MAAITRPAAAPLKNAYVGGDIGRTYRGDDNRDDCRLRDQGRMGPYPPDEIRWPQLDASFFRGVA